jgi:hypothetical protein
LWQQTVLKTNFIFTCRGGAVKQEVFEPIGLKSLEMCEDPHQEKYVMISLLKPKRVQQVKACIDEWNRGLLLDMHKIVLSPHDYNDEIITFGKGVDTIKSHYIYKTIMAERAKASGDGPNTWSLWTLSGESPGQPRTLKMLRSDLAGGAVLTSNPKRESKKPMPLYPAEDGAKRKKTSDTESDVDEVNNGGYDNIPAPMPEVNVSLPEAFAGKEHDDLPLAIAQPMAMVGMNVIIQLKDDVIQSERASMERERASMERERAAIEREHAMHKEMLAQALHREREKSDALALFGRRAGKK